MNVAFIPVRGGSKSIPLKNIKCMNGRPLVYWTAKAACGCQFIDKVYIATDSDEIRKTLEKFKDELESFSKIVIIGRSEESASDSASTEFVMLEFASNYSFDNIVLIQATSPLLSSDDLDRGFKIFEEKDTDSVLSVVKQKRFNWSVEDGFAHPTNYNIFKRPRRQEFEGYYVENGAFYITSRNNLIKSKNRISGNIKVVEMNEDTFFEIDEPSDWIIIEHLLKQREKKTLKLPEIKMVLMDCDGVLTDGGMYYTEYGDEIKRFNTLDGMGIKLLREKGIIVGIVTGEKRELNKRRAQKLKIDIIRQGVSDKLTEIKQICNEKCISMDNVLYVGDDINDLEAIKAVGYGCTVANGREEVKLVAKHVTKARGGEGAVREIADLIVNGGD